VSAATAQEPFITGWEAKGRLGWGWNRLYRAVLAGEIRSRQIPGKRDPRYYAEDVERVRRDLERQAAGV
jgi:hypothetical protein